jgi:Cu(I)/Ag(I) efflux system membrane fusion protein
VSEEHETPAPRRPGRAVPIVVFAAIALAAFVYRAELAQWFAGAPEATTTGAPGEHPAHEPAAPSEHAGHAPDAEHAAPAPLAEHTLHAVHTALGAYEALRATLARDSLEGLAPAADRVATALRGHDGEPEPTASQLAAAASAAAGLSRASSLEEARAAFAELSRQLVALASADARLREGLHLFECPMAKGYGRWLQPGATIDNPYMGQAMLSCGNAAVWQQPGAAEAAPMHAEHGDDGEVAYYTCPMHPSVRKPEPGKCPICGMDLTPVTKGEQASGELRLDAARLQRIGVRSEPVVRETLTRSIRTPGRITYDESRLTDVNLRTSGWVQQLRASETGQRVRKGQTLFTLYSPELYAAQREHLDTLARTSDAAGRTLPTERRLRLLGMTDAQIAALVARGEPSEDVPVLAPDSGYVIDKEIVEGGYVAAGTRVYRIADLRHVWLDADVYEADLPHVRQGQTVHVSLPHAPEQTTEGKVDYVYPALRSETRTGRVRVVLDNPELALKPDMYADVALEVDLGEHLVVPDEAILYTGPRRLVFVDLGEGRLAPREVQLGPHGEGAVAVLSGLTEGERVVTSGNFLIAAESRIRSATGQLGAGHVH